MKVGVTCDELDRIVHDATVERGAYPSPLNYHRFPKSVCTSVNEVGSESRRGKGGSIVINSMVQILSIFIQLLHY